MKKAENFPRSTAYRRKNLNAVFELQNEPDLALRTKDRSFDETAEYFAKWVGAAGKIMKEEGVPLGVNVSGGNSALRFIESTLRSAGPLINLFLDHPYVWPREIHPDGRTCGNPEDGGFEKSMKAATSLVKKYRPDSRFGIGEIGYAVSTKNKFGHLSDQRYAAYLARIMILADTYVKNDVIIWYAMINAFEGDGYDYGLWRNVSGAKPSAAVASYAQAIRALSGRTSKIEQKLKGQICE